MEIIVREHYEEIVIALLAVVVLVLLFKRERKYEYSTQLIGARAAVRTIRDGGWEVVSMIPYCWGPREVLGGVTDTIELHELIVCVRRPL
jgi:hypothetical protein